ncbi:MAG TPA: esterase-like activity of phytase family protein [Caulobacterales bacterium]|nr:esterase-like activity of phytase family protein [Caulobacterales bacterium]
MKGVCATLADEALSPLIRLRTACSATFSHKGRRTIGTAVLALALTACGQAASQQVAPPDPDQWRNITVTETPVDLGAAKVGALTFRGGVQLRSTDYAFGGLSGLVVLDDGRLIAISDNGDWLSARIALNEAGDLVGITEPRMALMRGEDGQPFADKEAGDSEDVTQLPDGRFAVSFEQVQRVRIYDLNRDGPFGAAQRAPALAEAQLLPHNEGLEALTTDQSGALIVGAEHGDQRGHMIWRAPLDAQSPVPPLARFRMRAGYGLAGFARLPNGDILALERFFAPVVGIRIRLEQLDHGALEQGRAEAREIAYFGPPLSIDNFEGVSAVRRADGGVRLYLISDNNFSRRQRTLLYAFDLDLPAAAH